MKTRTVYIEEPHKIVLKERNLEPGPDQLLIKTHAASICGTDKNYYLGHKPRGTHVKDNSRSGGEVHDSYPILMGHEGAGVVAAVGKHVSGYKEGDFVSSFYWAGTMGDYFLCPARDEGYGMFPVPKGMDLDVASVGEPTCCAVYAAMQSGVELGDTVAVVGAGFAGQVIAQTVKRMGAYKVIVVDLVDEKLKLAKQLGADVTLNPKECDVVDAIMQETNGYGVDVAIEVGGNEKTVQICTDVLKHGGILGFYSWILDPVKLYVDRWHNDGFDIRTLAMMHRIKHDRPWYIRQIFSILERGLIQIKPLLTHSYSLADASKAFEVACNDGTACKVALIP